MSFEKYAFISYIGSSKRHNARSLCYYLGRIERDTELSIDSEYERDKCTALLDTLKAEMNRNRRSDRASFAALRQMHSALKKYTAFRQKAFLPRPQASPMILSLLPEELEKELADIDWEIRDTMVGTVRDSTALDYILEHNAYYVPAHLIGPENFPIHYIALYEHGIGSEPGIRLYGKILTVHKLRRRRIAVPMSRDNPDELYYYFRVRYWDTLPSPIAIRGTQRGKPLFTNKLLLDSCTQSYQLFAVTSEMEFRLMALINHLLEENENGTVYRINDRCILSRTDDFITFTDNSAVVIDRVSVGSFLFNPADKFERIKKLVLDK